MSTNIPIEIVPYDPCWPQLFEQEKSRILDAVGKYVNGIEHIGSTAVPGLAAKPVIDILIAVYRLEDAPFFIPPLEALGYDYIAQYEDLFPERRYLHRIVNHQHTHHLHMVEPGSNFYKVQLLFRDYLRTHPGDAQLYADLKYSLANRYRNDRDAYTEGKSDFINEILRKAQQCK